MVTFSEGFWSTSVVSYCMRHRVLCGTIVCFFCCTLKSACTVAFDIRELMIGCSIADQVKT